MGVWKDNNAVSSIVLWREIVKKSKQVTDYSVVLLYGWVLARIGKLGVQKWTL